MYTKSNSKPCRSPTQRTKAFNNPDFTIKYRNPKFVESPSLEVLVRDEYSSMRCELSEFTGSIPSVSDIVNSNLTMKKMSSNATCNSQKHVTTDGLIKYD